MQPNLFSADPEPAALPPWEIDDLKNRKIVKVVFPAGLRHAALDYLVPNSLAAKIESGMRVLVPLGKGNRLQIGYCIDIQPWGIAQPNIKLKQVSDAKSETVRKFDDKFTEPLA